jgi:hypothetical protein
MFLHNGAVILNVDLCHRLFHDFADDLVTGADYFTNIVIKNRDMLNARRKITRAGCFFSRVVSIFSGISRWPSLA